MRNVIAAVLCMGFLSLVQAQTVVGPGAVSGLWTKSASPYQITGNIYIQNASTLTIEPGVKVEFQGHFELKVMGSLLAEGTSSDTIVFTVNDTTGFFNQQATTGGWYGIRIYDIGSDNDSTKLAYCRLEFGKAIGPGWYHDSGGALCVIDFDKVSVRNCLFIHNQACGPDAEVPSGGAVYFEFSNLEFSGNTFLNNQAHSGGAMGFFESDPTFSNNYFAENHSSWAGGAVMGGGISNPTFSGDVFQNNQSEEMGGAMLLQGTAQVEIDGIAVIENEARWAGGLGFLGSTAMIKNASLSDNLSLGLGGAIAADGSSLSIYNSTFERDSATQVAGAIHSWMGTLDVEKVTFSHNRSGLGGAIHADWSSVNAKDSEFDANSANVGGAMKIFNSHLKLDSCLFVENQAWEDAGAMDYTVDTLVFDTLFKAEILRSRFDGNQAGRAFGGFNVQQTHTRHPMLDLHIDACVISENSARQVGGFRIMRCLHPMVFSNTVVKGNRVEKWSGGGTIGDQSLGSVFNCLFADNHADTLNEGLSGGGLSVSSRAKVDVMHSTFAGNSAGRGGGMQLYRGGEAIVTNSLLWDNEPQQFTLSAIVDTLPCQLTLNFNDIEYGQDSINITDLVSTFLFGQGNLDTLPLFVNGDQGNFHLQETSPLLGAGIDSLEIEGIWYHIPASDLDGNPRPAPAKTPPDMGAYENERAIPVGIKAGSPESPNAYFVSAFPNPFNHSLTLELNLAEESAVIVELYNLRGSLVHTIEPLRLAAGSQRFQWEIPQDENDVYIYRVRIESLSGDTYIRTGRMIRIR